MEAQYAPTYSVCYMNNPDPNPAAHVPALLGCAVPARQARRWRAAAQERGAPAPRGKGHRRVREGGAAEGGRRLHGALRHGGGGVARRAHAPRRVHRQQARAAACAAIGVGVEPYSLAWSCCLKTACSEAHGGSRAAVRHAHAPRRVHWQPEQSAAAHAAMRVGFDLRGWGAGLGGARSADCGAGRCAHVPLKVTDAVTSSWHQILSGNARL